MKGDRFEIGPVRKSYTFNAMRYPCLVEWQRLRRMIDIIYYKPSRHAHVSSISVSPDISITPRTVVTQVTKPSKKTLPAHSDQ